ncbi:hypothetical protein HYW11_02340 [Candidatus Peregrinibacteria bacterium]|nr:hypothetical protein [Candidatus Peregrinibacteria bacterium]
MHVSPLVFPTFRRDPRPCGAIVAYVERRVYEAKGGAAPSRSSSPSYECVFDFLILGVICS